MRRFQRPFQWVGMGTLAVVLMVSSFVGTRLAPAQVTLDPAWAENPRTFGGQNWEVSYAVQQTSDGGYIVAGYTNSFGAGNRDVYLIKLDAHGTLDPAWDLNPKTFGGEAGEMAFSVQQTEDGGYIVAGFIEPLGTGDADVHLIKLDAQGNLDPAWDSNPKTIGGENSEMAFSVQQTVDGGYIVAGSTESPGASRTDAYLIKLDAEGHLDAAWDPNPKTLGGNEEDDSTSWASSVGQTVDGGYIVAGQTNASGAGDFDAYVVKLDSRGELDPAWERNPSTFGGPRWDAAQSIGQTADGGYVVVGQTQSFAAAEGDVGDVYVIKLDSLGLLDSNWDSNPRAFGDNGWQAAYSIQQTSDGGYVVGGVTRPSADAGSHGVYLIQLDSEGHLDRAWDPNPRSFSGEGDDWALSVQPTSDGGYVAAGWTESFGAGKRDVLVLKLAPARNFLRGDCNADGRAEGVGDAVALLRYNFHEGVAPSCRAACDANGDGEIAATADAIHILQYFFLGSEPPASPFPECGPGQLWTDGPLTCETEPPCP